MSGILARKLLIYLSDPVSFSAYMIYDFISKETAEKDLSGASVFWIESWVTIICGIFKLYISDIVM